MPATDLPVRPISELSILRVLWARGPSTVRRVVEEPAGYGVHDGAGSMQIMTEKRLVTRDDAERTHVFAPAPPAEATPAAPERPARTGVRRFRGAASCNRRSRGAVSSRRFREPSPTFGFVGAGRE
ncbi:MAG: BlaI/MecI/CopY family transcriptional regulator [Verrucomicrobiota bacterium]